VLALGIVEPVHDHPDRHAEELVDAPHPLGVAAGQVVVDGDEVYPLAGQGVQVDGQGRDQGLALAGLHLGDATAVQDRAADELDVEVPHVDGAAAGLPADGEGLGQEVVQGLAVGDALFELRRLVAELLVGFGPEVRLELADAGHDGTQAFEHARVLGTENLFDKGA